MPAPTKCPSRKYRRKPANLLIEYNRRQKAFVWLETHIWHAKRFHMIKKWGYKLPEKPTNKSFRACYRAISEHCLVTDISYYNCIELKGSEEKLLKGLQQCTSTDCGLTFAAKMYLSGRKEGAVTLFHPNSYPNRVIGNVTFFWKAMDPYDIDRIIWIWVHPLTHNEIIECFKNVFNLKATSKICDEEPDKVINEEEKDETASELKPNKKKKNKNTKSKKRIEQIKLLPKNVPFSRTPKYANEDESVTMTLLKDTLNRFQLTGPLSQAIISQAFNLIQVDPLKSNTPSNVNDSNETTFMETKSAKRKRSTSNDSVANKKMKPNADSKVTDKKKWWEEYYKEETSYRNWKFQKDFYEKLGKCSKPTDVPSGLILPLVIGDPRLKIPKKREKAVSEVNGK